MTKVAFIGAGGTVFAKNLMVDIWSYPELAGATICPHTGSELTLDQIWAMGTS